MPRRLLRDRHISVDEWHYLSEATATPDSPLIISYEQWQLEPDTWLARGTRLGLVLSPVHKIEPLSGDLHHFDLIAAQFPGPSDGRGYSQARLLRERLNYEGELRATGYVRLDQLFFLARCGFNSFELAENELHSAVSIFDTFSAAYQPSNDRGLARPLPRWLS